MPTNNQAFIAFTAILLTCAVANADAKLSLPVPKQLPAPLTAVEMKNIAELGCKPIGFALTDGQLQFGDTKSDKTINNLYLIKNITKDQVVVDYPEAHVGASAWVTQTLAPMQWTGFFYMSDKDLLNTENGPSKPTWHCNAQDPKSMRYLDKDDKSYCNQYLYICKVTQAKLDGTPLQKNAAQATTKLDRSWWIVGENMTQFNSVKSLTDLLTP